MGMLAAIGVGSGSGAAPGGMGKEALAAPEVSETTHVPPTQHRLAHGA